MLETCILLAAAAALIVALALAGRRGWVPATRDPEKFGELTIDLKCDAAPIVAELKPVNAELERMAGLLDRIGVSLPQAVAAAKQEGRARLPEPKSVPPMPAVRQPSTAKPRSRKR